MRWRLLRRRLSISAPRMTVRSHLPWPVRWALAAVVLGFSGALALWAFEVGKGIAGLDHESREAATALEQARQQLDDMRRERDRAQSIANTADRSRRWKRKALRSGTTWGFSSACCRPRAKGCPFVGCRWICRRPGNSGFNCW